MEVADMLDVLHYLFEMDVDFQSAEQMKSRSSTRKIIYKNIYNVDYAYNYGGDDSSSDSFNESADSGEFMNAAKSNDVKPYFPPTDFNPDAANPFGSSLRERPLN
jgi:hypothetical protein